MGRSHPPTPPSSSPLSTPQKVPSASPTSGRHLLKEWVVRDGAEAQGERPAPLGRVRGDLCSSLVLLPLLGFRPRRGRRRRDHEGASTGSRPAFSRFQFYPRRGAARPRGPALFRPRRDGPCAPAAAALRFPRTGLGAPTFPRRCPLGISSFCDNRRPCPVATGPGLSRLREPVLLRACEWCVRTGEMPDRPNVWGSCDAPCRAQLVAVTGLLVRYGQNLRNRLGVFFLTENTSSKKYK